MKLSISKLSKKQSNLHIYENVLAIKLSVKLKYLVKNGNTNIIIFPNPPQTKMGIFII